jgi:hypothetical protein
MAQGSSKYWCLFTFLALRWCTQLKNVAQGVGCTDKKDRSGELQQPMRLLQGHQPSAGHPLVVFVSTFMVIIVLEACHHLHQDLYMCPFTQHLAMLLLLLLQHAALLPWSQPACW